jgi:hypothetical protein
VRSARAMLRLRSVAAALVAFLVAPAALADDAPKPKPKPPEPKLEGASFFSMPFLFGVDAALAGTTTSTGFFWGFRPEVVFGWRQKHADGAPLGFGFGPYANIVGSTGTSQVWLGGGGTVVGYFGHLGVAASAGLDADWWHSSPSASPVVGLFVGFRTTELGGLDAPLGLRVDYRPPVGVLPSTVIVSTQLDLLVGFAVLAIEGLMRPAHGFD